MDRHPALFVVPLSASRPPTVAERIARLTKSYDRYREAKDWIAAAAIAMVIAELFEAEGELVRASRWLTRRNRDMRLAEAVAFGSVGAGREGEPRHQDRRGDAPDTGSAGPVGTPAPSALIGAAP